ncbi:MAG: trypsin-like peptidase domain-containing protein [Phycisphaerae bacterium]|nr:trypsin-like peptidase domain-containing protein [Phycisphaerae bacterium]
MRTLMLMLLAGLVGCGDVKTDWACGTEDPPPPEVTVFRVSQCWFNEKGDSVTSGWGTGFPISSNGIITYRHALPPYVTYAFVEAKVASILDRGSRDAYWDDWMYVEFQSPPDQVPVLDPKVELHPGERVAIVGFSAHGDAEGRARILSDFHSRTVYGKVVSTPFWLGLPEEVVLVKVGDAPLNGLSGGPVMVLRDNNWVVIGSYVGIVYRDILNGVFSSKLHIVRRIPEHLIEE